MRPVSAPGTRRWLLLPAAALILAGLAAGCSSSKPAYCTDAANLKTSVQNLGWMVPFSTLPLAALKLTRAALPAVISWLAWAGLLSYWFVLSPEWSSPAVM